jgi:hypothetical protein
MRKFFQFFSLTILTQGVLFLNQIALLPIQIRIWGHASTAYWCATLALATIATVADFGLRTAGHAELIRYAHNPADEQAKTEFQHLWAWIRILICVTTIALIALDLLYTCLYAKTSYPLWRAALTIGVALETTLGVRIMYLDSLELYREAEAGYLLLAAARLCLAIGALIFFHSAPDTLAWIWFFTGIFAIAQQSKLCRRIGLLRLFEPMPPGLSLRTLAIARHTMADPASNWMRNSVPVLVLSAIAQPVAVTTYVALRGVFGAARATIRQLSRYASVQYVCLRQSHKMSVAEVQLTLCVLFTAFVASVLTCIVIADNFRLGSLLLVRSDATLYQAIAITFGLGSPFYAYQILQALMLRYGKVREIARRQYLYITCLVIFAAVALLTKSVPLWLVLTLVADIVISLSFMLNPSRTSILGQTSAGARGFLAALTSALLAAALWLVLRFRPLDFLQQPTTSAIAYTLAFLSLCILVIATVYLYIAHDLLPEARTLVASALGAIFNSRSEDTAK